MLWIEGRNLMDGRAVWLPFEIVHADWRACGPPASGCFATSTNGLSSGKSFFGAVRHALCEIIERDATSLWHEGPPAEKDGARIDLTTIDDAESLALLDLLAKAGLDVGVWDITTDVEVCAYQCLLWDPTGQIGHVGIGAACHPRREMAFLGAVLEAAQVRTTYIIGSREDIDEADYDEATLARRNAEARALMRPSGRMRTFASSPSAAFASAEQEVGWILDRLRSIGLAQAIVVDLTRPEYAIPVVRVVVPGLEGSDHHRSQYSPGPRARAARGGAVVTAVVFVGPTLEPRDRAAAGDFHCLPPVAQGDVYRAVRRGARAVGVVDGYFSGAPSVWHKEILWALSQNVPVFGGASMGALRAAELHEFGMRGVGRIFEAFRDGNLEDDDEVAVVHGPAEIGYLPASEPMVNIRATLALAEAEGVIGEARGARSRLQPRPCSSASGTGRRYSSGRGAGRRAIRTRRAQRLAAGRPRRSEAARRARDARGDEGRGPATAGLPFRMDVLVGFVRRQVGGRRIEPASLRASGFSTS